MTDWRGWVLFLPLVLFLALFAGVPAFGIVWGSLAGAHGLTLTFYRQTLRQEYANAFLTTMSLSGLSGLISVVWGFVISWNVVRVQTPAVRRLVAAVSSTMANFAGMPLAVAFMATLGTSGLLTVLINQAFGISLAAMGWNLASFSGLTAAYTSFLVPLAVILLLPAVSSLRREWEEAAYTLGADLRSYLRRVALPILLPSATGVFALLFANAFSTYVTSYELAGDSVNLVPILIGYVVNGNVSMNIGLGDALAVEEMIVMAAAVGLFLATRRRTLQGREGGQRLVS